VATADSSGTSPSTPEAIPAAKIGYIIDQATYERELEKRPGLLYGWNGAVNGGATIVRSTDYGETYTAGLALVRALPTVPWLARAQSHQLRPAGDLRQADLAGHPPKPRLPVLRR